MFIPINIFQKTGHSVFKLRVPDSVPIILVLLAAFLIRIWDLAARSLWFDEAYEYWSAVVPIGSLPQTVNTSYQPPLYTFLLHFWLLLGDQAAWLRLLSVGVSMITVAMVMALARKTTGKQGALIAGVLLAVFPSEIRYAQEAGEYALMEAMLACSIYFLYLTFKDPSFRNFLLWALFSILAVYSHYGTAIVVAGTSAAMFIEKVLKREWKYVFKQISVSLASLLCAVPLYVFFFSIQDQAQAHAKAPAFTSFPTEILNAVKAVGQTFLFPIGGWPYSLLPKNLGYVPIYLLLLIAGLVLLYKGKAEQKRILAWFWSSFFLYYLLIRLRLYGYGNLGFRYMIILVPLFVLVIAATPTTIAALFNAIRASRFITWFSQTLAYVLIALMVGIAIYSLPNLTLSLHTRGHMAWPEVENLAPAIRYWTKNNSSNAPIYVYYDAVPAFRYYLRTSGHDTNGPLPATWLNDCFQNLPKNYCRTGSVIYGEWVRYLSPEAKVASIEKSFGDFPQAFWIIFSHNSTDEENAFINTLSKTYTVAQHFQTTGASLYFLKNEK